MAKNYHPSEIESKWQKIWEQKPPYRAVDPPASGKEKFYGLVELPYISGEGLHLGHAFTFTILDILARKKRMEGFNVLDPMGWDAFGLPTENYAIKSGIHPAVITKNNSDRFRQQIKRLGLAYDWEREINTTDPDYYRWTQWIFLQLFKHGLAYKTEMPVGWCPACKIILANEEIVNGNCERCGAKAEHRHQKQWLLRITAYADRLTDELDLVDYPEYVKQSQRNWIGKTEGIVIEYPIINSQLSVKCYSTRPDTNFGATFVVIAPEHPLIKKLTTTENQQKVQKYIKESKEKSELERTQLAKEKTGVFTGSYALNRLTGKKMPIWVADFVVLTAGTGIVVGVPAHDERDWQFAKKFGLEIVPVIKSAHRQEKWNYKQTPFLDIDNAQVFNSGFLNGLPALKAKDKIIDYLVKKGWGVRAKNYHLRDWIFSRQHYWGEPIPMIYCPPCAKKSISWWDTQSGKKFKPLFSPIKEFKKYLAGWFPLKEQELPLKLPEVKRYQPTDTGESPLANIKEWVKISCPECGFPAQRETDTMPNWAGSSWYFLRYTDPGNRKVFVDYQKLKYWLPVDIYLGGAEHTTLHLLYSRFWYKFLSDLKLVPGKEPYQARRQHGVILGEDGFRMSKSKGNVINPEDIVEKFGADTLRIYLMFMGPYESTMPWNIKGLEGCYRFLSRVWRIFQVKSKFSSKTTPLLVGEFNRLTKKVGGDIESLKHNTAIAALMEFLNHWNQKGSLSAKDAGIFLKLLAPFAPFLSEELWSEVLAKRTSIHQQPWPNYDPKLMKTKTITLVVQVNGRLRGQIQVLYEARNSQPETEKLAKTEEKVAKYLIGKRIKKIIFVPGKLINFVV